MENYLLFEVLLLLIFYIFVLLVLRACYFMFYLKKDPVDSIKITMLSPKSIMGIFKREQKEKNNSKWG